VGVRQPPLEHIKSKDWVLTDKQCDIGKSVAALLEKDFKL